MWKTCKSSVNWIRHITVVFTVLVTLACLGPVMAQEQFPRGEFPLTDFKKSSINLDELLSGGPPRDGIPSIDKPHFVSVSQAGKWLDDREPVIAVNLNGEARAYPLQILMYHEIVNDVIADMPVAITFCPLCNASIVFDRTVGEGDSKRVLDFGTTGRLRKSDLVMYDRQTESWWQQFTGKGIIGEYTDVSLPQIPSQIVSFAAFKESFGDSKVLSKNTGVIRPYGNNPYRGYDAIDNNPFLFRGDIDPRSHPACRSGHACGGDCGNSDMSFSPIIQPFPQSHGVLDFKVVFRVVKLAADGDDQRSTGRRILCSRFFARWIRTVSQTDEPDIQRFDFATINWRWLNTQRRSAT